MLISMPAYYESFRCLAGACPDSCCKEWSVLVDEESAEFYRGLSGPLGDRLREVLVEEDGETVMKIENGRCPMWRQDGLCRIQAELGELALCQTCSDFPRLQHDFGAFGELQLELSCPEAARLILTSPMVPRVSWEEEAPEEEAFYDAEEMAAMLRTREQMLSILASPGLSPGEALLTISRQEVRQEARPAPSLEGILEIYKSLEILQPAWPHRLENARLRPLDPMVRPLARYLLERYWLREPLGDRRGKLSFVLGACILINSLEGDFIANAQSWSKEIENSDCNPDELMLSAHTEEAMALESLRAML